jgi:hypothetical protein
MKKSALAVLLLAFHGTLMGAVTSDIPPVQKRMATIDLARTLLTTQQKSLDVDQKNPFNPVRVLPGADVAKPITGEVVAASDREILLGLSESIAPSGMMQLGGTPILLFGQKKLKVGDSIQIMFKGASHDIKIMGIERTSYTLRLNKEEITRPIKPR